MQLPSPPRPRLRLKRRNVSQQHQLTAPTQQFLASVAAADLPIPSIEEPEDLSERSDNMSSLPAFVFSNSTFRTIHDNQDILLDVPRGRAFSPPKTPALGFIPSLSPPRYPDWTMNSSFSSVESTPDPDYESSRPSTSRSTQTSTSLFSRLSQMSDDDNCASPDFNKDDHFVLLDEVIASSNAGPSEHRKGTSRKAPWTKAMSTHLWSTYVLYLEDPKVTPFRMEKSCIPPPGVCLRVAREARRSWKGSKVVERASKPGEGKKSGSSTPTAENPRTFMEWPHTCAATRAHLRELCKLKAARGRGMHNMSRSPTPFSQAAARHWNRRVIPGHNMSAFATQDVALSLAVSTSDSMQPNGPLAQLTSSAAEETTEETTDLNDRALLQLPLLGSMDLDRFSTERRRLGSPFGAKSYGPSSSNALAVALDFSSMPSRQPHTVGHRRALQSPVRLSRSGTQKRRNTQSGVPLKRPSLVSDIWVKPNSATSSQSDQEPATKSNARAASRLDDPFGPDLLSHPNLASFSSRPNVSDKFETPTMPPPRLGSPFSGASSSFSFPRRAHRHQAESVDLGMLGRPYATMQFQHPAGVSADLRPANLTDRLSYIDQRLKDLRNRDARLRSPL